MANLKNAMKKIKVDAKREVTNNEYTASMKTAIKNVETAVSNGESESADVALKTAIKKIDKATSKGAVKDNTGARKKSRLTKKVNQMK